MIAPQKFPIKVTQTAKGEYDGTGYPTTTQITILEANRAIQRMSYNRIFQIMGKQVNAKATYVLYLEINDPDLVQNADIEWVMHGKIYTGKIKFTQPMNRIILNRNRECYIQSDNE